MYFILHSFRGEHECSLMRVEAADVASALDKLSYEKVSRQGRKGQQKFSSFLYFYDSTYLFAIGILCMIEDGQNFVTL